MNELKLNNGYTIPQLGYGTIMQNGEQIINNVSFALNNGYKLIDTANRYGNEVEVGEGLKKSRFNREDYFVETKLGPTLYENDNAIDDTLKRLGLEYVDVMILHHPVNNYIYAYHMLENAYKEGKIKAIGISNFPIEKLEELLSKCEIKPMIMQMENHPYYQPKELLDYLKEHEIAIQGWYPLGHGSNSLMEEECIVFASNKYHKTPAQIILRWHLQKGYGFVVGSKSETHIKENADIFDFSLTDEEMDAIDALNKNEPFYHVTPESLQRLATTKCNFEE